MIIQLSGILTPSPRALRRWNELAPATEGRKGRERESKLPPSTDTDCNLDTGVDGGRGGESNRLSRPVLARPRFIVSVRSRTLGDHSKSLGFKARKA